MPSPETLEFLGQWLAGRDAAGRVGGTATLAMLAARTPGGRTDAEAVLAFAYCLAAARGGHPSHDPADSRLTGADLTGWRLDGGDRRLDLRGLSLTGADLTGAVSGGGWSPDGTRLLTTSDDGTARIVAAVKASTASCARRLPIFPPSSRPRTTSLGPLGQDLSYLVPALGAEAAASPHNATRLSVA